MTTAATQIDSTSPAAHLRSRTADVHWRVEHVSALQRLRAPSLRREEFAATQALFFGCFAPLEASVGDARLWSEERLPHVDRSGLLAEDLSALGVATASLEAAPLAREADTATLLGRVYVLEGSRLGARLIRRALLKCSWFDPEKHGRFFAEPETDGSRWRRVQRELDRRLCDSADLESAATAAVEAFELIEDWMRGGR